MLIVELVAPYSHRHRRLVLTASMVHCKLPLANEQHSNSMHIWFAKNKNQWSSQFLEQRYLKLLTWIVSRFQYLLIQIDQNKPIPRSWTIFPFESTRCVPCTDSWPYGGSAAFKHLTNKIAIAQMKMFKRCIVYLYRRC